MAQTPFQSAGVYTSENDNTFLPNGVPNLGGAIVAPFPSGPGFSPTLITNQQDLQDIFGIPDGVYYGPYTAQQYLAQQGSVTIVRVGALGGYTQKNPLVIKAVRGQYTRATETSDFQSYCFSGSVYTGSGGSFTSSDAGVVGFFAVTFYDGVYSGSTYNIGYISGSFNHTASTQVSASTFVSASVLLPVINDNSLQFTGSMVSASLFVTPQGKLRLSGSLIGNYGPFNPSTFNSSSFSRDEDLVLAVLANTAYDSAQNLWGFDGSTLVPSTTSSLTTNFTLNLNEVSFSIASGGQSSSYGAYDFSLDRGAAHYFTNVFGTDPQAGIAPLPAGYNPSAAYVYTSFPAIVDDVVGQMLNYGWWKIQIETADEIINNPNVIDCVPEALNVQTEFVTSYAMQFSDGVAGGGSNTEASSAFDLREAVTPWVISQNITPTVGNEVRYELFRVHTLSDGTDENTKFKIEISDILLPGSIPGNAYGSFTLALRAFDDTDLSPLYLETYTNCTLNPTDANFVARLIGDTYTDINFSGKVFSSGQYPAQSKYIRIEMSKAVYPTVAVPFGFEAYATPIGGFLSNNVPAMTYTSASIYPSNLGQYASGIDFSGAPANADAVLTALYPATNTYLDNQQYFAPIPEGATIGNNVNFSLDVTCGLSAVYNAGTDRQLAPSRYFVFGFQGGFDGQAPSTPILIGDSILPTNQQGLDCSSIASSGSVAYSHAIGVLSNADLFDINLLSTPGINYADHPYVAELALDMCQTRGDVFYILDLSTNLPAGGDSIETVINLGAQFNSNYAASYYPWINIKDTNTNQIVPVPPSVVMPAVFAANDAVAAEWFAPAGSTRGGITQAVSTVDQLDHADRDALYAGKINPIATFPGEGIIVWGQKTLQNKSTALNRINVRRLLIALKKKISKTTKVLTFEQNTTALQNRFLNIVNPYLTVVQQRSGLYAFKVICDNSTNPPDQVDQNILQGNILIQPTRTAEFIKIPFSLQPTGATFGS